jgi:hypothetical protein
MMFVTQGPVDPDSDLFVGRRHELARINEWAKTVSCVGSVLGPRQTGKTSLLQRASRVFCEQYTFVPIDLQCIEGSGIAGCLTYIADEILHKVPGCECAHLQLPDTSTSFLSFLRSAATVTTAVRIVVTLDEFGALPDETGMKLAHTIRAAFTVRHIQPELKRYCFVLAGGLDMLRLTSGRNSPLKNVTQSIYMEDLAITEVRELVRAGSSRRAKCVSACDAIYGWTLGHPYWTQLLASRVEDENSSQDLQTVDDIVEELLQNEDKNLPHLMRAVDSGRRLAILRAVLKGDSVRFSRTDAIVAELELVGAVRNGDGTCIIRNRIYESALRRHLTEPTVPATSGKSWVGHNAHALLIGVGSYVDDAFSDLPATVADARTLATVLGDPNCGGYPARNVQVLTGRQANKMAITGGLRRLAEAAGPESTVIIFFSGHGGRARTRGKWASFLCPYDANSRSIARTAITGEELTSAIAAIKSKKVLVIIDACHAGGSADLKRGKAGPEWKAGLAEDEYQALARGNGRVVIASSSTDQVSWVRDELSLFTHHLCEALRGYAAVRADGFVHVLDVFHYVNEAVRKEQPRQTPVLKVKDLDLNFPLTVHRTDASHGVEIVAIDRIREAIVHDPQEGARALSQHIEARPQFQALRAEVDLKRAELERLRRESELFGRGEHDKSTESRIIYSLLRLCLDLQHPRD